MIPVDAVTTEVIGHYLLSVAEEMGVALIKSSYSTNIKERADASTAVFTAAGETAAQASYQPLHLGSMLFLIDETLARYPFAELRPGDMFIANDPYGGGGSHLPDFSIAAPIFAEGRLVAWVATIAHHSDIGGRVHGSQALDNRSIFEEGIRVPVTRIYDGGVLNEPLLTVILHNSRVPEERAGDLRAQFAANRLGELKLAELAERYGADVLVAGMDALLDANERAFRVRLAELPRGFAECTEYLDDDGIGEEAVKIHVRVTVEEDGVQLDFAGSDPQTAGARNLVASGLHPTCFYAVKGVVDPTLGTNGGYYRGIRISAPEGTVVNPLPPAATCYRIETAQRVVDAILGAFAEMVPERVQAACMGSGSISISGYDPALERGYSHYEAMGGGSGATLAGDGNDAIQVHMRNSGNVPVEVFELEFPMLVERYELIPDSGGAGRRRGGLGIRRDVRVLRGEAIVNAMSDRHRHGAGGLQNGGSGACGRFLVTRGGEETVFTGRISELHLGPGDGFSARTSGGGGFGDPSEREPALLAEDVADGKVVDVARYAAE